MAVRAEARPAGRARELPVCSSEGSDRVSGAPWAPVPTQPAVALGWDSSITSPGELEGWIASQGQGDGRQRASRGIPEVSLGEVPRIQGGVLVWYLGWALWPGRNGDDSTAMPWSLVAVGASQPGLGSILLCFPPVPHCCITLDPSPAAVSLAWLACLCKSQMVAGNIPFWWPGKAARGTRCCLPAG